MRTLLATAFLLAFAGVAGADSDGGNGERRSIGARGAYDFKTGFRNAFYAPATRPVDQFQSPGSDGGAAAAADSGAAAGAGAGGNGGACR